VTRNYSTTSLLAALSVMSFAACSDDQAATDTKEPDTSSATSGGTDDPTGGGGTGEPTTTSPGSGGDPGDPGAEPPPAGEGDDSCDAGHEAWVKRAVPLLQGRRPEGMREVKLLVAAIEQLDALGKDGRRTVARGLASGDLYLARWKTYFWEQLKINRVEIKANPNCYSATTGANSSAALAEFIRDNDALNTDFGSTFTMADVMESALRLDDLSPMYRADMFARMARPLSGANISQEEFEVNARSNYGELFESSYLGRRSGCLECHTSVESVTYNPDPAFNHFWAIPGDFEGAVYGASKGRPEDELFAAFRWTGFVVNQGGIKPWGASGSCGRFDPGRNGDLLNVPGYVGGDLPSGQHLFDVDPLFKSGFATLAESGLSVGDDLSVAPDQALAFMTAVNIAGGVWKELLGYPLVLAHGFPRNEKQREILGDLTDAFIADGYSLRSLLTEVVVHPYFNQDSPDECRSGTPYFMQPVFDPFSITAADPNARGNGVGDRVQRYSAWVLIESAMRAMWWELPVQQVAPMEFDFPGLNFLRDQGVFIKDAVNGFNGVDFNGLLSWENQLATGTKVSLQGACTGPLGGACSQYEWLELMLVEGSMTPGVTVRDVAAAIKDRLITEPVIDGPAEEAAIAGIFGVPLDTPMNDLDTAELETAARRFAGVLFSTPQFMLSGVPSRDQDPAAIPRFAVPGTDTESLCNALMPAILGDQFAWSCSADGVKIGG
jgi:hypothetical protein